MPSKTAPATASVPKPRTRGPRVSIDASALDTIEALDAMPSRQDPMRDKLAEAIKRSFEAGRALSFTVPTAQAKPLASKLHQAAATVGLGVQVRPVDNGDGTTRVAFRGRTRRARKSGSKGK